MKPCTDPSHPGSTIELTQDQKHKVTKLCDAVGQVLTSLERDVLEFETNEYPPPGLKQPRIATVFGLTGPRGSGKTTVLQAFLDKARGADKLLVVRDPIDCSLVPEQLPLLLNVIHRVHTALNPGHGDEEQRDPCLRHHDVDGAFRDVKTAAEQATRGYHTLLRELAISPAHYGSQASACTEERFLLPHKVMLWLKAELSRYPKKKYILLALDDVDLALRGFIESILGSLLDELHQARLILVLAADMERLEQLVRPTQTSSTEGDLHTAQDLLQKIMPYDQRVELLPWEMKERRELGRRKADPNESVQSPSLQEQLDKKGLTERFGPSLIGLLPRYPRGLDTLYQRLLKPEREDSERDFLPFLARVRGEHALGRMLEGGGPDAWARALRWPDAAAEGAWDASIDAAADSSVEEIRALPILSLAQGTLPLSDMGSDTPFWVEILLDSAMRAGALSPRSVLRMVDRPEDRFQQSRIHAVLANREVQAWIRRPPRGLAAMLCWSRWEAPTHGQPLVFGLDMLCEALNGTRSVWPEKTLEYFFATREDLLGEPTSTSVSSAKSRNTLVDPIPDLLRSTEPRLSILPKRTRALLLFCDALARAPWSFLSANRGLRGPMFLAGLTAGFTWGSYLRALGFKAGEVPGLHEADLFLLTAEDARLTELLDWEKEDLLASLWELGALGALRAHLDLPRSSQPHPVVQTSLLDALKSFHALKAFRRLFELENESEAR